MIRSAAVSLCLSLLLAAAARAEERLPVPPIPPAHPPTQDAPIPNFDLRVPGSEESRPRVTLDPDINRREPPNASLGYGAGARYRTDESRKPLAVPGLQWHVPIQ